MLLIGDRCKHRHSVALNWWALSASTCQPACALSVTVLGLALGAWGLALYARRRVAHQLVGTVSRQSTCIHSVFGPAELGPACVQTCAGHLLALVCKTPQRTVGGLVCGTCWELGLLTGAERCWTCSLCPATCASSTVCAHLSAVANVLSSVELNLVCRLCIQESAWVSRCGPHPLDTARPCACKPSLGLRPVWTWPSPGVNNCAPGGWTSCGTTCPTCLPSAPVVLAR